MKSGRVAKGIFGTAAVFVLLVFSMSCAGGTAWGESAYESCCIGMSSVWRGGKRFSPRRS